MSLPDFNYESTFKYTLPPDPDFQAVVGAPNSEYFAKWRADGEKAGFSHVDPKDLESRDFYRLLISGVIPRPIAFVSSVSEDGKRNLAPFSYFNVINSDPPLLMVSFSKPAGSTNFKDTAMNILATKQFTVNIISDPFIQNANWTCVNAPPDVDEWIGSGLTPEPSTVVKPPRVKESAFSLECELYHSLELKKPGSEDPAKGILIIGLIRLAHVRNDVLVNPEQPSNTAGSAPRPLTVDPGKLKPILRMGGISYAKLGDAFEIPRPEWEDEKPAYEATKPTPNGDAA